ncbi:hypothetical protein L6164_010501 [Bauhinia variegata]|uniref:Uncharacterized protein n=1 Tax=Bauhinia variegata TaxID=167791 RepID=A0ACB9PN36_BAUVA|nr:hypothetical protein L6164_010501 [Bauhinia variegata]
MGLQIFHACNRIHVIQCSGDRDESFKEAMNQTGRGRSPAEQFAPLATTFQRRLLVGIGSSSLVAVGANFGGITSFLLGLSPETGRNLKLDVLYPIGGYNRCIDTNEGFANWVGDQTLLYRAAKKAEVERSLDPPPLNLNARPRRANVNEPVVAFGPPGSTGELNVSVIVSPVPEDFSMEAFGGPTEVGEGVIRSLTGAEIKGKLIESSMREDWLRDVDVKYYQLEFKVESQWFRRHNVAVCCARGGRLFTLNAQAPESEWPGLKSDLYTIANSFTLTT